jgi:hypothetical protein
MEALLSKYRVISLGYNCYCKGYIDEYLKACEYNIFDFLGTSVWSITDLLKNNFEGLLSTDQIKKIVVRSNEPPMFTNMRYYVRFTHDNFDDGDVDTTIKKLCRRIERFNNQLKNNANTIIFLRLEEGMENRVMYEQYSEKNKASEYEQLVELSTYIKLNKNDNFKIIYFCSKPTNYDRENNIICINVDTSIFFWQTCANKFHSIVNSNSDFIKKCLQE